jgi:hypothetical protein
MPPESKNVGFSVSQGIACLQEAANKGRDWLLFSKN